MREIPAALLLLLCGCSTWTYSVRANRPEQLDPETGVKITAVNVGGGGGFLKVTNPGPRRVYLVWDSLSVISSRGIQQRAFKGDQIKMLAQSSVPPQPIEPGASIQETYGVTDEATPTFVKRPRPMVWGFDIPLCFVYGIGCLLADLTWTPDADYQARVLPAGKPGVPLYDLVVPVATEGAPARTLRLSFVSAGIDVAKNGEAFQPIVERTQAATPATAAPKCDVVGTQEWASASAREKKTMLDECRARAGSGGTK